MPMKPGLRCLIAMTLSACLAGCAGSGPDYTPIGDGLKAIGICLVVYGVVQALADLVKSGNTKPEPRSPGERRPKKTPARKAGR